MTALIMEPLPWQYCLFPLVLPWQGWYACLALYLPEARIGLATGMPPHLPFQQLLEPPRQQVWQAFARHFQPGELQQWQAYLQYLAVQEDQEEEDLQAAIRGTLAPVLPAQLDRQALWSLAYQLEQTLADKAAGLQRLAAQEKLLAQLLGEAGEEPEALPLDTVFNPSLAGGAPDLPLARLRWQFWQEILAPQLEDPWVAVVLEPAAGEGSPRHLWESEREEGRQFWQARFRLPGLVLPAGPEPLVLEMVEFGVAFRKTLAGLLQALTTSPPDVSRQQEALQSLLAGVAWPAAVLGPVAGVSLEIYGWPQEGERPPSLPPVMMFLSPAD